MMGRIATSNCSGYILELMINANDFCSKNNVIYLKSSHVNQRKDE